MHCVDCHSPATTEAPAIHSFDDQGRPNGSMEWLCESCIDARSQENPEYDFACEEVL